MTPLWAIVVRVSSACSNARFTHRSRTVLFHDGSCWPVMYLTAALPFGCRAVEVRRDRFVVRAPHGDRRVVAELVDRFAGLAHGLLADRAGVAPLQREVLPQQHAELVGGVVQLGTGDVAVHPQEVEAGLAGQLDVAAQLGGRRVAQRHPRRRQVGALHEHRLAVDGEDPVLQHHLAQAGAHACGCR